MEVKVLRENIDLQVEVTISNCDDNYENLESNLITFRDCLTFQAKYLTYVVSYDHLRVRRKNIVFGKFQKIDQNEKCAYKITLSCKELGISNRDLYADGGQWRILNENAETEAYTFIITFQIEALPQVTYAILYDDEQLIDFKLIAHDGDIGIHKAFLAVISAEFKSKVVDANIDSLYIPETSVDTLRAFKKCIYTEVLPDKNLKELLLLVSYFKIIWLEFKCVDKIMKNISADEAITLMEFALKHSNIPLFLGIIDLIQSGHIKVSSIRKHYLQQPK